ncbi:calcium uniporter protein 3, mitochondrial-like [Bidens hawaiensis]|uniref:calcium uniporter protein 3, mitochondrial-like n=1 Tax=Bidens hawaiensis TaxID=980011 RepID=UPI0040494058
MAFKQNLIHRMLNICNTKLSNQTLRNCRISPSSSAAAPHVFIPPNPAAPDPGDQTVFRRLSLPNILRPKTENILERLKQMDITRNRVRLDALSLSPSVERSPESSPETELTAADAKKILRVLQIEKLKSKLKSSGNNNISYDEYVEMCVDGCGNRDQGLDLAKALDDSGDVIILGNVVFLKPEQVVKAIHSLLPKNVPVAHNRFVKELEEMEQWKSAIDTRARNMVQRELWGGLAYLIVQTSVFMRLTFWELSWDVMEPICFYVTSMYFMAGYTFFLRTSKEPSFEGFYQSRFSSKQMKLMKREGFDVEKYKELRKACYPHQEPWPSEHSFVDEGVKKTFT